MKMERVRRIGCHLAVICLIAASFPGKALNQQSQQINLPQGVQMTPQLQRYIETRTRTARTIDRELRKVGVPFGANLLLAKNWQKRLEPVFAVMPQMQVTRLHTQPLTGALLAGELQLPEKVDLTGDTVIIARRVRFLGNNVVIKGPHSIHFFVVESLGTATRDGFITIDTSGIGKKEWLEANKGKQSASARPRLALTNDDTSGTPGAKGMGGVPGNQGRTGDQGVGGVAGSCNGNPNGGDGNDGGFAGDGDGGGNGGQGGPGTNAGDQSLSITDPGDMTSYNLIAKGGDGGDGGDAGAGGPGGTGGNGGAGGAGGAGVGCYCSPPGGIGSGGYGGAGGRGGRGGSGGDGGPGGPGGRGGNITISYPSGYDINRVSTNAGGGAAGRGGSGNNAGIGGRGGDGAQGGPAGSLPACGSGNQGQGGNNGQVGDNGERSGSGGAPGTAGEAGSVTRNQTGGGGDSGPYLEPGGGGGSSCTEYWWVWYQWSCETGLLKEERKGTDADSRVTRFWAEEIASSSSLGGRVWRAVAPSGLPGQRKAHAASTVTATFERCGWQEVSRMYAGCW